MAQYTEEEIFKEEGSRTLEVTENIIALPRGFDSTKNILLPVTLRDPNLNAYWESVEGKKDLEGLNDPAMVLQEIQPLLTQCLGQETVDCIKKQHTTLRAFFERSTPTTQCMKTVGSPQNRLCWICGTKIFTKDSPLGLTPECEHVFPIAQALVFTGLYEHDLFEQLKDDGNANPYVAGLRIEYDWAHQICNQVKNDSHFIQYSVQEGFTIDPSKIATFLTNLSITGGWGTGLALVKRIGNGDAILGKAMLLARADMIRSKCLPILQQLSLMNKSPEEHAKNTAMFLKEYIALDDICSKTVPVANIPPSISPGSENTIVTSKRSEIVNYGIKVEVGKTCVKVFGTFSRILRQILVSPQIRVAAKFRGAIIAKLFDCEVEYKKAVIETIASQSTSIQHRIYSFLRQRGASERDTARAYNAVFPPAILGYIIKATTENVRTRLFQDIITRVFSYPPGAQQYIPNVMNVMTNPDFISQSAVYYQDYTKKFDTAFGNYYGTLEELISTPETPNGVYPKWVQGGFRKKTKKTRRKRNFRRSYRRKV